MSKITESDSHYDALEQMSTDELLVSINKEDSTVSTAVKNIIPNISALVNVIVEKLDNGGRLFYLGAIFITSLVIIIKDSPLKFCSKNSV